MAAVKAPVLDASGKRAKDASLEPAVFGVDVKRNLLHETVRAELNAQRAGTRGAKSRGLVAGGRAKPFRQKGTGRARAGTTRAPQFTGGGVAFPPQARSFDVKVNRKVRKAALRGALSAHAGAGTLGVLEAGGFEQPSTKAAVSLLATWGKDAPFVVVTGDDDVNVGKSFRNIERTLVVSPAELDVASLLWARSVLLTESALEQVQRRAGAER
jgi:large subunit ribosomal protein L4